MADAESSFLLEAADACYNSRFGRVSLFPIGKQGKILQACAAESHSCALDDEGKIICWGLTTLDRTKVPDQLKNVIWKELSCGGGHTCAIDSNGWPACWGFGVHGQVS
jgi:alpha-tubulin suppressor-like RCC1 family protein